MTLTELRYITALARERHFGRAAQACHVSQPTLSVAIKKLEDELGIQLFERRKTEAQLTPIGEQVVEQAQRVLVWRALDGAPTLEFHQHRYLAIRYRPVDVGGETADGECITGRLFFEKHVDERKGGVGRIVVQIAQGGVIRTNHHIQDVEAAPADEGSIVVGHDNQVCFSG